MGWNAQGNPSVSVTHGSVTAASSVSQVALAASSERKWAYFVNDGTTAVYLVIATSTGAAAKNTGIRLNANGGTYEMSSAKGNLDIRTVHVITAESTGHVVLVASAS